MLLSLRIQNVVLIDRLDLPLAPGLCALTGETGAGKSILLDALGLALGARSESGLVRKGAERGSVTALFELGPNHPARALLDEQELEADRELVLRRTITADGRSRAFINDQPVSVSLLRRLGATLVEVQSARQQMSLLDPSVHRVMLDSFAGLTSKAAELGKTFDSWRRLRDTSSAAEDALEAARRDEDFLRHALAELDALKPEAGEEAQLSSERARLIHGRKLADALATAQAELCEGRSVEDRIGAAQRALKEVAEVAGGALDETLAALNRAAIEAADGTGSLAVAARALDLDPRRLEEIEDRLFALHAAARKHQSDPDSLPGVRDEFAARLAGLEDGTERLSELKAETETARDGYLAEARALGRERARASKALDSAVSAELEPLRLGDARFETRVEPLEPEQASREGLDKIRFEVAMNPGTDLAPLERVASSGELSRLLLALKVVLSKSSLVSTLIFDEIDRGIGGATAEAVGEHLARLAREVQVLVVTHSPQVAARADHHLRVTKQASGKGVVAELAELDGRTRREEIARMLAGARITDEARAAADKLIHGNQP